MEDDVLSQHLGHGFGNWTYWWIRAICVMMTTDWMPFLRRILKVNQQKIFRIMGLFTVAYTSSWDLLTVAARVEIRGVAEPWNRLYSSIAPRGLSLQCLRIFPSLVISYRKSTSSGIRQSRVQQRGLCWGEVINKTVLFGLHSWLSLVNQQNKNLVSIVLFYVKDDWMDQIKASACF